MTEVVLALLLWTVGYIIQPLFMIQLTRFLRDRAKAKPVVISSHSNNQLPSPV